MDLFRAPPDALWRPARSRAVFGGQVVGQALAAAQKTVPDAYRVHSLHSYFLRPAQLQPIVYYVTRLRDGASFVTRSVRAMQRGQAIFQCTASFHRPEPDAMVFQPARPAAPPPAASVPLNQYFQHPLTSSASAQPANHEVSLPLWSRRIFLLPFGR